MDFPEGIAVEAFERNLVPGAVFLCENFQFDDGSTRDKYLVILSRVDSHGSVRFFLATSQVENLRNNPILALDCLFIPADAVECFVKDTAINTRTVYARQYLDLKDRFLGNSGSGALVFKCHLGTDYLNQLWTLIQKSRHIPVQTKQLILPDHLTSK